MSKPVKKRKKINVRKNVNTLDQAVLVLVVRPISPLVNVSERDSAMGLTIRVLLKSAMRPMSFVPNVKIMMLMNVVLSHVRNFSFVKTISTQHPSGRSGHSVVHRAELVPKLEV